MGSRRLNKRMPPGVFARAHSVVGGAGAGRLRFEHYLSLGFHRHCSRHVPRTLFNRGSTLLSKRCLEHEPKRECAHHRAPRRRRKKKEKSARTKKELLKKKLNQSN